MDKILATLFICLVVSVLLISCKHEPFGPMSDGEITPVDTTGNPIDTTGTGNPADTSSNTPCDPNLVYFQTQVLPILQSNCALSGCHDDQSAQDGVVLSSYAKVMSTADVEPGDLSESKLYKVLVDDDPEDRMPQTPRQPLAANQIELISKWIQQGAKDLICEEGNSGGNGNGCATDNRSFSSHIAPILQTHCITCHSGPLPSGGYDFTIYSGVKKAVDNNRLVGAIQWQQGFTAMPYGSAAKIPDCAINQIKAWVDAGAPNN